MPNPTPPQPDSQTPRTDAFTIILELCYRSIKSGQYANDEEVKDKMLRDYYNEPSFQCLVKSIHNIFITFETENQKLHRQNTSLREQVETLQEECKRNNQAACLFDRDVAIADLKTALLDKSRLVEALKDIILETDGYLDGAPDANSLSKFAGTINDLAAKGFSTNPDNNQNLVKK